jgi:hypothetical protein
MREQPDNCHQQPKTIDSAYSGRYFDRMAHLSGVGRGWFPRITPYEIRDIGIPAKDNVR